MIGGIVEIEQDGRHISVDRGFMKVTDEDTELGRVPLDDITSVILSARRATLSRMLMAELAERKATIIICGGNYHPVSLVWPFDAHYETAGILRDQINASRPLQKRLWQKIVRAKIQNQSAALDECQPDDKHKAGMSALVKQVKSGDPDNREAQAARLYWPALMGEGFRRDRDAGCPNNFLNYGYAILRAATARAICGAGLHPSLGLHHHSRVNSFALVDDVMEPFRPLVDMMAYNLKQQQQDTLTPEVKREIATILQEDMLSEKGVSPVINCMQRTAQNIVACLQNNECDLTLPSLKPAGAML